MAHSNRPYDWVGAISEKRAALTPDRIALRDATSGAEFTYRELDARANRTARLLDEYGVTDGERVVTLSRNRAELVDLYFGTAKTGGVLAPLSHRLAPRELAELTTNVEPALFIVEEPFVDLLADAQEEHSTPEIPTLVLETDGDHDGTPYGDELPTDDSPIETEPVSMNDPHLFLHTGGSTGIPKETILTHGSILWNSFNTIVSWGLREDDVTPMVFPMFHTGGWNVLTVPLFHVGGTVTIAREFDPEQVLDLIEDDGATVFVAVPAMFRMLTDHERWADTDLSTLRFAKSGGGPCRERVMEAWWSRGVDLSQGYGLTECGPNNFAMPDDWAPEKAASVGKPVLHADARVVADGEPVSQGEVGELELASPHAAAGYWRNEAETEETFGSGWVSTGDLVQVDEDGYYHVVGRKKNMFVSGGENVYPPAIENVIADHPKVEEVVVIGVPDETWGTVGKAVVEGDESLTLDELRAFLDGKLARFTIPRQLSFVDEMPMSGPSKIDRTTIEDEFGSDEAE